MAILIKTIESLGTEADFIKKLIHTLTAADKDSQNNSRITCDCNDDDIDAMFGSNAGSDTKPEFTFTVAGVGIIKFQRHYMLGENNNDYYITTYSDSNPSWQTSNYMTYRSSTIGRNTNALRACNVRVISGVNSIMVKIANWDNNLTVEPGYHIECLVYYDDDHSGFSPGKAAGNDIVTIGSQYYVGEDYVLPVNRLPYTHDNNNSEVEIIKSKVMKQSTAAIEHSVTTALYDCSTLPSFTGKEFILDGESYYALNNNTIFKLTQNE